METFRSFTNHAALKTAFFPFFLFRSPETIHFSSTAIVWKFSYNLTRGCLLLQVLQIKPAHHGLGGPSSCTNRSLVGGFLFLILSKQTLCQRSRSFIFSFPSC